MPDQRGNRPFGVLELHFSEYPTFWLALILFVQDAPKEFSEVDILLRRSLDSARPETLSGEFRWPFAKRWIIWFEADPARGHRNLILSEPNILLEIDIQF
jgi:hypothetical protein